MSIPFAKMHGLGNDFMVLDRVTRTCPLNPELIRCWSDRHTGVGFDQLLLVEPPTEPDSDFRYRIYNADGSEAEQCGNGARCVARFVMDSGLSPKQKLRFETSNGHIETLILDKDMVEVDMGMPALDPAAVPFDPAHGSQIADSPCWQPDGGAPLVAVSIGNPHGVMFVSDLNTAAVNEVGAQLNKHPFFPEKVNVGFCQIVDSGFVRLRVFERGVGETRACGTGACAAAVAGRLTGKLGERVKVSLPGGKVRIRWQGPGTPVRMTGPATLVFHGHIPA